METSGVKGDMKMVRWIQYHPNRNKKSEGSFRISDFRDLYREEKGRPNVKGVCEMNDLVRQKMERIWTA